MLWLAATCYDEGLNITLWVLHIDFFIKKKINWQHRKKFTLLNYIIMFFNINFISLLQHALYIVYIAAGVFVAGWIGN